MREWGGEKRKGREEKREKRKDNALLEAWGKEARSARRFAEGRGTPRPRHTLRAWGTRHRGKKEEEEKRREKEMCGWVMEGLTPQRGELQVLLAAGLGVAEALEAVAETALERAWRVRVKSD